MALLKIKIRYYIPVLIFLLAATFLTLGIDRAFRATLDNVRTFKLERFSKLGLDKIRSEKQQLDAQIADLQTRVNAGKSRQLPNLREFKELAKHHRLRLDRMEKINSSDISSSSLAIYTTAFEGQIGGIVRFLRDLEEKHIFVCNNISVYSVDEEGEKIALNMAITLDLGEK